MFAFTDKDLLCKPNEKWDGKTKSCVKREFSISIVVHFLSEAKLLMAPKNDPTSTNFLFKVEQPPHFDFYSIIIDLRWTLNFEWGTWLSTVDISNRRGTCLPENPTDVAPIDHTERRHDVTFISVDVESQENLCRLHTSNRPISFWSYTISSPFKINAWSHYAVWLAYLSRRCCANVTRMPRECCNTGVVRIPRRCHAYILVCCTYEARFICATFE
jgi:hypothetical protein